MQYYKRRKALNCSVFRTSCIAAVLLLPLGCTDLMEFDHALQAGITIVDTPDLSVIHTIENISGARSLCIIPDYFIVATMDGMLFRFDLESFEQSVSFAIGDPSSSGYFEMEFSLLESSVYIIGALGQIIELHVPDMEIMDSFRICDLPVDIEIATEKPFFYVAGANSCRIYEVRQESNGVTRYCTLQSNPTCMAIDQNQDTILVGTLTDPEIVSIVTSTMWRRKMSNIPRIVTIETIPNDTTFCAVLEFSTENLATILYYFDPEFPPSPVVWTGTVTLDGSIHYMCAESDGSHAYVLSYLGDNISRLVSYNCSNYSIESQIDLQGYPLDLEISPEGKLLVLTAE